MKSSPPMFMAMTMFMLSEAEDRKIMGVRLSFRISAHQWYPLRKGSPISSSTRWGAKSENSSMTRVRSPARRASQPQELIYLTTAAAMASSSSTRNILYIDFLQISAAFPCKKAILPAQYSRPSGKRQQERGRKASYLLTYADML